jgi:Spy/CpxP family protein refolding chaperone
MRRITKWAAIAAVMVAALVFTDSTASAATRRAPTHSAYRAHHGNYSGWNHGGWHHGGWWNHSHHHRGHRR